MITERLATHGHCSSKTFTMKSVLTICLLCVSDAFFLQVHSLGRSLSTEQLHFQTNRVPEGGGQEDQTTEMKLGGGRRQLAVGDGFWSTKGSAIIDSSGNTVHFSGVNWGGFEGPNCVVDGLYPDLHRTLTTHLTQMSNLGFNLIRLPFAGGCVAGGRMPAATAIDFGMNPQLVNLTVVEVIQKLVTEASLHGIRIILDYHRMQPTQPPTYGPEPGLWFDAQNPVTDWLSNWQMMATVFKGQTTIVGADLFNEPHPYKGSSSDADYHEAPVWDNSTNEFNWKAAATKVASLIHAIEPGWLICVQGMWSNGFWGENLQAVATYPLVLSVPNKVVYQIHDYGPEVSPNAWFYDPTFPANLPAFWDSDWGFVHTKNIAPVWIGEFGTLLNTTDTSDATVRQNQWFNTFLPYIQKLKVSWTFFTWGPNSADTGGILQDDWHTARADKLAALQPIFYPQFQDVATSGGGAASASGGTSSTKAPSSSAVARVESRIWISVLLGVAAGLMVQAGV